MRTVVKEIVDYLNTGIPGDTLRLAEQKFGSSDMRRFCFKLCSWWGRGTLMQSRHPYLAMGEAISWHQRFRQFVESVPELKELVYFEDDAWHFAKAVERMEWQAINDFTRTNYMQTIRVMPHYKVETA